MNLEESIQDQILINELGKVGEISGAIIGRLTGGSLNIITNSISGKLGARWGAKLLKSIGYNDKLLYHHKIQSAMTNMAEILSKNGKLIDTSNLLSTPHLTAVIGSGAGNMNPTIVCVEFIPISPDSTSINIYGTAKEGLIKQRSAEKAVKKIIDLFQ
ncbi:hypothetical protein [Cohnella sp. WQ 127256]|uniref:hypothetical protein n=1 Tax=Cohnella sp. WQ 127256 TaxID=2938790 RepID=UPI0021175579|nr:hypothetical protein [Cohnella sp. WQ 127256]